MEEYIAGTVSEGNQIMITQGKYYNKIHEKHIASYGEHGASNIRENIMSTFKEAIIQTQNPNMSNNMLLVGKVQSGKTSNLELFTALAFDNGYNLVIIYGGYDNTLLNQTTSRFKKTFDIPAEMDYADESPVVFSSDDSAQLLTVDDQIVEDLLDANKPIFLISMKRPVAMRKVNALLSRINKSDLKAFIIDDEGDQASLNTKKNKATDASATYHEICTMKEHLNDPLYLSVTATPQALIFLDEYSRLRPDSIRLIEPGSGYCGAEAYHLYDSSVIEIVDDEDQEILSEGVMVKSLRNAIHHYLIATAIMIKRGKSKSDMIIHSHRMVSDHDIVYGIVEAYIQTLKDEIEYDDDEGLTLAKKEFLGAYTLLFSPEIRNQYDFDDLWALICNKIISRVYIILKNSTGTVTQANEDYRRYKIYIGGDLLQRGVTFSNLVTTYFTRWAKDSGNMDTNLQRARWFGYREKYIDICKIFTSCTISREFTNLSEMEADLWEQFHSVETGEMYIDDILVKADNTKQKPTRKNVANYSAVSFKNKWIKQRVGVFDKLQIESNNKLVDDLLSKCDFTDTTVGRKDSSVSAKYAYVKREDLSELIDHMAVIFDLEPFEKRPLQDLIESSGDIPLIIMKDKDGEGRERSFYPDNRIYALQQGADNKDKAKAVFLGDSHVIVNKDQINIQIYKIIPKKKVGNDEVNVLSEYTQYMFAIYVPKEKKYFVKG